MYWLKKLLKKWIKIIVGLIFIIIVYFFSGWTEIILKVLYKIGFKNLLQSLMMMACDYAYLKQKMF